jgi:glycerophosphoryl diester phosphodiesterase
MVESEPLLPEKMGVPQRSFALYKSPSITDSILVAEFISAKKDAAGRKLPQAIAHRGYKAAYPENTMGAFKGAVDIGAHAIETDVHLSKDGVVVLSHVRCLLHLHLPALTDIRMQTSSDASERLRK